MGTPVPAAPPLGFTPRLTVEDPLAAYWLRQVTLRLRREISWLWHERGALAGSALQASGLPPYTDRLTSVLDLTRYDDEKRRFFVEDATAGYLTGLIDAHPPEQAVLTDAARGGFAWLARALAIDDAGCLVLALALTSASDAAAATVFAACHNDEARPYPTLALALRLWDAPAEALALCDAAHALGRHGFLASDAGWDTALAVPPGIARQLLFPSTPVPDALERLPGRADEEPEESADGADGDSDARLVGLAAHDVELTAARLRADEHRGVRIVPVYGAPGAALASAAARIASALGVEAVQPAVGVRATELPALCTLAWLRGLVLYVPSALLVTATRDHDAPAGAALATLTPLPTLPLVLVVGLDERGALRGWPTATLPTLRVRALGYQARLGAWRAALRPALEGRPDLEAAVADCARRFRHEAPAVRRLSRALRALERPLQPADLHAACRADVDLGELAQPLEPRFRGADLMLPLKQTRLIDELIGAVRSLTAVHHQWGTARAWNESGLSALFAGPPGTGKTMAAEVVAAEAGMPLFRIDLSQVVNKYIGETEKNLSRLFDAADAADAILFFDEADALFGKRTEVRDAHDRYANLEVSYLLERMERFKGLAILATNRKKDLDEAFLRRLRFVIEFPLPGPAERLRIWQQVIPADVDARALDLPFLAERFQLAGGHIRAVVLHACLQSASGGVDRALDMPVVLRAVRRELDKLGRTVSLEQFSPFAAVTEE